MQMMRVALHDSSSSFNFSDIQLELESMLSRRRPFRMLGAESILPPLVQPDDEVANAHDENTADTMFLELCAMINTFIANHSGTEINLPF